MAASAVDEATNVASHQAVAVEGRMVKRRVKAAANPGIPLGFDQTVLHTNKSSSMMLREPLPHTLMRKMEAGEGHIKVGVAHLSTSRHVMEGAVSLSNQRAFYGVGDQE